MATTTVAAICDRMLAVVAGLTPTVLADAHPYKLHNDWEADVRTFARANPDEVRLYSIRDTGDLEGPEGTDGVVEWVIATIEMVMAYSRKATSRWGADCGRDLDAVMAADRQQIEDRIGPKGYPQLDVALSGAATVYGQPPPERKFEFDDQVVFSVLRLRVGFWRATT